MEYKLLPNSNCTKSASSLTIAKKICFVRSQEKFEMFWCLVGWWSLDDQPALQHRPLKINQHHPNCASRLLWSAGDETLEFWKTVVFIERLVAQNPLCRIQPSFFLRQPLINGGRHRWQQDYKLQTRFLLYALLCPKIFGGLCVMHSLLSVNIARCKHCNM